MGKCTVIINNRNLLTWPREMVATIEKWDGLHKIVIIDNDSTYRPLLDWYKAIPHEVVRLSNLGHAAPFECGVLSTIETDYYVVTDPDMGLLRTPSDTLIYLMDHLSESPFLRKIGLGLDWTVVPKESPYYAHTHTYEASLWKKPYRARGLREAGVDTTFAMYDRRLTQHYFIGGARCDPPYIARHYPWELTKAQRESDSEFMYYLANANHSSSFKTFLKLSSVNRSGPLSRPFWMSMWRQLRKRAGNR